MSAFLGPIHFWLYKKILFQENLIKKLVETAKNNGWDVNGDMYIRYVNEDRRALEELIDQDNIHGWLQNRINDAEERYAFLLAEILRADETRLSLLKETAFEFGKEHKAGKVDATAAYQVFDDLLLNGMPCDRVNVVTSQTAYSLEWEQTQNIHKLYLDEACLDEKIYEDLRISIMNGVLIDNDLEVVKKREGIFEIRK